MKSLHNVVLDWKESGKRGRKYRCGGGFLLTNSISILSRVSSVFDIDIFVSEKARDSTRRYGCPRRANFRFLWRVLLERNVFGLSFGWRTCQDCHKDTNLVGQHDINSRLFTDRCVTIVWKLELENKAEGVASLHGRRFGNFEGRNEDGFAKKFKLLSERTWSSWVVEYRIELLKRTRFHKKKEENLAKSVHLLMNNANAKRIRWIRWGLSFINTGSIIHHSDVHAFMENSNAQKYRGCKWYANIAENIQK